MAHIPLLTFPSPYQLQLKLAMDNLSLSCSLTWIVQHVTVAVIQEPGIDIVLDPTGDLERCLATALTKAQLRELSTFAPVTDQEQRQKIRELCAMWDMDLMLHGMAHVSQHGKLAHIYHQLASWAARYNTCFLIRSMSKGAVFSFLSHQLAWCIVTHSVWLLQSETAGWL